MAAIYETPAPKTVKLSGQDMKQVRFRVSVFNKAVRHLFDKGRFSDDMLEDEPITKLRQETVRCLMPAVDTVLIDADVPEEMAAKLRDDVFIFSGCKTYHELKEVSQLLADEDGQVKPLHRFIQDVKEIHPKYNERYLEAERNFAIMSSQMAGKWAEFERDGDEYDLQYFTAGDKDVRPDHAALDGITLPYSDPFWAQYTPPNGWNCRCGIKQVLRGKYPYADSGRAGQLGEEATTSLDEQNRNRAEMFRFNPGVQQVVFPPSHPYYMNVPDEAKIIPDHE